METLYAYESYVPVDDVVVVWMNHALLIFRYLSIALLSVEYNFY